MNLHKVSLESLIGLITGDSNNCRYRTYNDLIKLFESINAYFDHHNTNSSSRSNYVLNTLLEINNSNVMNDLLETLVDKRYFVNNPTLNCELFVEKINNIIRLDGYELYLNSINQYKIKNILSNTLNDHIEVEFDAICETIINHIKSAEFTVWISMAWFTNKKIFNALKEKKDLGLDIKLILFNDETNKNSGLNYNYFETYFKDSFGYYNQNKLHTKFCIVDFNKVLEGSFNWTNSAEYNDENLNVLKGTKAVSEYSNRFLKQLLDCIKSQK